MRSPIGFIGLWTWTVVAGAALAPAAESPAVVQVAVDPPRVKLVGPHARWQLLVNGRTAEGRTVDLTPTAGFRSAEEGVAAVDEAGVVRGIADGGTVVLVRAAGREVSVPVVVEGSTAPRRFHFENDIIPILSRFGCNASGCHGKAEGQNGFKLSVFGFDPAADYDALTKEGRGRRVFVAAPERSLLLLKAAGLIPHGGGVRIPAGSDDWRTLRDWIAAGMPFGLPSEPAVAAVRVEPREAILDMRVAASVGAATVETFSRRRLRVTARYADGREVDVGAYAKFQSNNDGLASVDETGLVTAGEVPGEAAVMVSFMGAVDVCRVIVPRPGRVEPDREPAEASPVDRHVLAKLRKLNITPSEPADDAEFLRRVHLDVIGRLPTADEAAAFLADRAPDKRDRLVDSLLERPEYADFWALKWADLLRVDRQALGHKRAYAYYKWVRDSVAANKPYDRFVRELLTAEGPLNEVGPANFYKVVPKAGDAAAALSQVLLGVRIACAECHHHPFDRWSQTDYYGMAAFFAPAAVRGPVEGEVLSVAAVGAVKHPRSGEPVFAHALGTPMPGADPAGDRRAVLADWMTAPDNPWFARNLANRMWAHFFGRGPVEPVDDVRATNPPSNPELLDALAEHLVRSNYDVRSLIRLIVGSRTYQRSSRPNATNAADEQNYSRALLRRPPAEVLLDMVCDVAGVPEKFAGTPAGMRAVQLWDSKAGHYFLKIFGRPVRATACECERVVEPSVSQILHVLNAPELHAKLAHEAGTVARLVRTEPDDGRLVERLYLTFFARHPSAAERAAATAHLGRDRAGRRKAAEDLAWAMMNTLEFLFNH